MLAKSGVGLQISVLAPSTVSVPSPSPAVTSFPSSSPAVATSSLPLPTSASVPPSSTAMPTDPSPSTGKTSSDLLLGDNEKDISDSHQEESKEEEGQKLDGNVDVQEEGEDVHPQDVQKDVMEEDVAEDSGPDVEELSDSSITEIDRKGKGKSHDVQRRSGRRKSTRPLPTRRNMPTRSQTKRKAALSPSPLGKLKKTKKVPPSASLFDSEEFEDSIFGTTELDPKNCYSHKFFTNAAESIYETMSVKTIRSEKNVDWQSFQKYRMDVFLQERGLWNSLMRFKGFDAEIVREFYSNVHSNFAKSEAKSFGKVYVRSRVYDFSPDSINAFLETPIVEDCVLTDSEEKKMMAELTGNRVREWSPKFSPSLLSWKYSILQKLVVANWMPSKNNSVLTLEQARLLFKVGMGKNVSLGNIIFSQIYRARGKPSTASVLPFPNLICAMLQEQGLKLRKHDVITLDTTPFVITAGLLSHDKYPDLPYFGSNAPGSSNPSYPTESEHSRESEGNVLNFQDQLDRVEDLITQMEFCTNEFKAIKNALSKYTHLFKKGE